MLEAVVETKDILETVSREGSFRKFVKAVKTAGLTEILKGEGPLTVFAPTDEAFAKMPKGSFESMLRNQKKLNEVLTYHMIPGKLIIGVIMGLNSLRTLQGGRITVDACAETRINDAEVVQADIECSNGVVHGIDRILLPQHEY
jgi:uncharacterized surface protein with fasciclin (FAS1) repeats